MEDETLLVLATCVVVEMLFFVSWCEGSYAECLCFTTGENRGSMDAWQGADFAVEFAEIADLTAVCTHAFFHDGNTERLFLKIFEGLLDIEVSRFRSTLLDGGFDFVAECADFLGTLSFRRCVDGCLDAVAGDFVGDFEKVLFGERKFILTLLLATLGDEFFLGDYEFGYCFLGENSALTNSSSGSSLACPSIMITSCLLPT